MWDTGDTYNFEIGAEKFRLVIECVNYEWKYIMSSIESADAADAAAGAEKLTELPHIMANPQVYKGSHSSVVPMNLPFFSILF